MLHEILNHEVVYTPGEDLLYMFEECFMEDLVVLYARFKNCIPGDNYGPATRDHFIYYYVLSGKAQIETLFDTYDLEAGCGFLAFQYERTTFTACTDDPAVIFHLGFKGIKAGELVKTAAMAVHAPVIYHQDLGHAIAIMNGFLVLGSKGSSLAVLEAHTLFYEMVSFWAYENSLTQDKRQNKRYSNIQEMYIAEALVYIEQNYYKNIQISQIADYLNINPSYFSRIFKKAYKMTASSFLQWFRLEAAKNLLDNSSLTVNQIAIEIGFKDPAYFISVFKKTFSMTPKQYREQNKSQ